MAVRAESTGASTKARRTGALDERVVTWYLPWVPSDVFVARVTSASTRLWADCQWGVVSAAQRETYPLLVLA